MQLNRRKLWLVVPLILGVLFLGRLILLGKESKEMTPKLGVTGGKLQGCSSAGNCRQVQVSRLIPSNEYITRAVKTIQEMGGTIKSQEDTYLHAEFESGLFGFVDDFEVLLANTDQVEVRSASRVGKYDFEANQNRIDKFLEYMGR